MTKTITVRYFASIREAVGCASEPLTTTAETVGDVRTALRTRGGAYAAALAPGEAVRMALNQTMVDEATPLSDGAELAFFPPVTGG